MANDQLHTFDLLTQRRKKLGLSKDTLRRYRKDGILKKGVDWRYKDVYGRRISWDVENVQKAIHEHASRRLEIA